MTPDEAEAIARRLSGEPVIDGRRVRNRAGRRLQWRLEHLTMSPDEREEAELERRLRGRRAVTRANVIALMSATPGVGKTTSMLLIGSLLATHMRARAIAIAADPDALGRLWPGWRCSERAGAELLDDLERLHTAAELNPYVSRLPTGLHVLAGSDAGAGGSSGRDRYGELVAFLSCFYEVVLLDVGTAVRDGFARCASERADQLVFVTTPEWLTASGTRRALSQLPAARTMVAVNKSRLAPAGLASALERCRDPRSQRVIGLPYDEQLAGMVGSGTFSLDALGGATRRAIKRLGLEVAERLV
jgi:MinD-like ATPase involved in chromosome partitioning or flagellar assembly